MLHLQVEQMVLTSEKIKDAATATSKHYTKGRMDETFVIACP